jgi:hypothetical protein
MSIQNPYQTSRPSLNGSHSPYKNLPQQQSSETSFDIATTTRKITQEENNDGNSNDVYDEFASLWVPTDLAIQTTIRAEQEYSRRMMQASTKEEEEESHVSRLQVVVVEQAANSLEKAHRPLYMLPVPSFIAPANFREKANNRPASLKHNTESQINPIGLTQMAEDDADEIQMSDEQLRLGRSMVQMRKSLEAYVNKSLWVNHNIRNLNDKINTLALQRKLPRDLVRAMHTIRDYGNSAAHCRPLPCRVECERAVKEYRNLKSRQENSG